MSVFTPLSEEVRAACIQGGAALAAAIVANSKTVPSAQEIAKQAAEIAGHLASHARGLPR